MQCSVHLHFIIHFTSQGLQQRSWINGESMVAIHVLAKQILKSTNTAYIPCHLATKEFIAIGTMFSAVHVFYDFMIVYCYLVLNIQSTAVDAGLQFHSKHL